MGRLVSWTELITELENVRKKTPGVRVVFTNGCFDILHLGHVRYLQHARAEGDLLVVGLNSDASVKRLKGETRPVQTENDRGEILAALGAVNFVTIFDQATPLELIQKVEPNVLVKGGDWPVEKIVGHEFVKAHGGQVKSLPFVAGHSTTGLIERILKL